MLRDGVVIAERGGNGARTHGERLPRELMEILDAAGAALREIDGFAISVGPGSFTGLRVGIATVQGLALAQRKQVIPVSSFEALAYCAAQARHVDHPTSDVEPRSSDARPPSDVGRRSSDLDRRSSSDGGRRSSELIAVWIDAHRGEVFASLYAADARTVLAPATSLSPAATLDAWAGQLEDGRSITFIGDGALKYAGEIRGRLDTAAHVAPTVPLLAGAIARIAHEHPVRAVAPHAVVPLYVRRPDAELARDRRQASG